MINQTHLFFKDIRHESACLNRALTLSALLLMTANLVAPEAMALEKELKELTELDVNYIGPGIGCRLANEYGQEPTDLQKYPFDKCSSDDASQVLTGRLDFSYHLNGANKDKPCGVAELKDGDALNYEARVLESVENKKVLQVEFKRRGGQEERFTESDCIKTGGTGLLDDALEAKFIEALRTIASQMGVTVDTSDMRITVGSFIFTVPIVSNAMDEASYQRAETARLALQSSLSAFMDHGTCQIPWTDDWTATASTTVGANWSESGDTETRTLRGGLTADGGKSRYCLSFAADGTNDLSKRNDGTGSNEVDVTQLKGTAALKVGLLRGEAKKQTAFLTEWYTVYSYVSYGRGKSIAEDKPDNVLTRTEANAWQVAGGIGFQAQGKVCGSYDINAGYYSGKSDAESYTGGVPGTPAEGDTKGGTFSFSLDCPLKNYPIYWNGKLRHDTDDDESVTNYGLGLGYNITDNMRFEIDWERSHVKHVKNKMVSANFIYDFFKR